MAMITKIDGPLGIGNQDSGFGLDIRPGVNPDAWYFNNTYAWPTDDDSKPSIITLKPAILDDAWPTTQADSGIYARDRLSHYTTDTGSWEEYPRLHAKDWVFLGKQPASTLTSVSPLEPGCGIVVHLNPFGAQMSNGEVLQVYFGSGVEDSKYRLFVREDGYTQLGYGAFTGYPVPQAQFLADGWIVPNRWGSLIGKWTKIFILPHGRNRILISSSAGAGWVYEDPTKSRKQPDPSQNLAHLLSVHNPQHTITSVETFPGLTSRGPVTVYTAPKAALQVRAIHWMPSGTLTPNGPSIVGQPSYSNRNTPVQWAATSALLGPTFVGVDNDLRDPNDLQIIHSLRYPMGNGYYGATPTVTFSRPNNGDKDTTYTPILYRFNPVGTPTPAGKTTDGTDLSADLIQFNHTHDKEAVTGLIRFRYGDQHATYQRKFNIPFSFTEDGNEWLKAICLAPELEQDGDQVFLQWGLQDLWRILETTQIGAVGRLDGYGVDEAVQKILVAAGWPSDGSLWDIDPTPTNILNQKLFRLSSGEADDAPTNLTDVVRSAADWLRYIRDTYTSSSEAPFQWVMGFRPFLNTDTGLYEYRFYFKDPAGMSTTPVKTFYPDETSAIDAGADHLEAYKDVHQQYRDEAIEPEANDVKVIGLDQSGQGIFAHQSDEASVAPNTALADRPANWLGERREYILLDGSLNTQALVTQACALLFKRLSRARVRATFACQWEPTLRLWDTCRVYFYDQDSTLQYHDWRVTGISDVEHLQDTATDANGKPVLNRPCTLHVERWL